MAKTNQRIPYGRKLVCGECGEEVTRISKPTEVYETRVCKKHGEVDPVWNVPKDREKEPVHAPKS